jgi:hypothetical protein
VWYTKKQEGDGDSHVLGSESYNSISVSVVHKKNKKEMEIVMYWEARITRSLRTYKMLG